MPKICVIWWPSHHRLDIAIRCFNPTYGKSAGTYSFTSSAVWLLQRYIFCIMQCNLTETQKVERLWICVKSPSNLCKVPEVRKQTQCKLARKWLLWVWIALRVVLWALVWRALAGILIRVASCAILSTYNQRTATLQLLWNLLKISGTRSSP